MARERVLYGQEFPWLAQVATHVTTLHDRPAGGAHELGGFFCDIPPTCTGLVPFEHGEFGMMPGRAFAVTEDAGKLENPLHPCRQQFFHREFG